MKINRRPGCDPDRRSSEVATPVPCSTSSGCSTGVDARAKLISILPTMYEPRRLLSGDQLAELLKLGNVLPPIPRSVVASEAVLAGRSIVAYAPKSPVSVAYQALAVRIQQALF